MRWLAIAVIVTWIGTSAAIAPAQSPDSAQASPKPQSPKATDLPPNEAPPRSDSAESTAQSNNELAPATPDKQDDRNFSSSRETLIDVSAPKDDLKEHPNSAAALSRAEDAEPSDVNEFHQWNPMKALKDVEVGDYYFKRKNYKAAMDRYKEALFYKENDAVATFRLAVCQEKVSDPSGALANYTAYLKILPHGEFADEARSSVDRLGGDRLGGTQQKTSAVPEKP